MMSPAPLNIKLVILTCCSAFLDPGYYYRDAMFLPTLHTEVQSSFFSLQAHCLCSSSAQHPYQVWVQRTTSSDDLSPNFLIAIRVKRSKVIQLFYIIPSVTKVNTAKIMASTMSKETIGDLRNNLMKLTREIKRMKLSMDINLQG